MREKSKWVARSFWVIAVALIVGSNYVGIEEVSGFMTFTAGAFGWEAAR